jgi:hypothetical protein
VERILKNPTASQFSKPKPQANVFNSQASSSKYVGCLLSSCKPIWFQLKIDKMQAYHKPIRWLDIIDFPGGSGHFRGVSILLMP